MSRVGSCNFGRKNGRPTNDNRFNRRGQPQARLPAKHGCPALPTPTAPGCDRRPHRASGGNKRLRLHRRARVAARQRPAGYAASGAAEQRRPAGLMRPLLASTAQIDAALHSDSRQPRRRESRCTYLIGNLAQRAAATGGGCAVQRSPRSDRISTILAESAKVSRSILRSQASVEWAYRA